MRSHKKSPLVSVHLRESGRFMRLFDSANYKKNCKT